MRTTIATWIHPNMCGVPRAVVQSYRGADKFDPETGEIVPGVTVTQHRVCGKRAGHAGEHGPWGRMFYWRWRLAEWIENDAADEPEDT